MPVLYSSLWFGKQQFMRPTTCDAPKLKWDRDYCRVDSELPELSSSSYELSSALRSQSRIYQMAYSAAPLFACDIRSTYLKIVDFRTSLKSNVSSELRDLLIHFLKDAEARLGRHGTKEDTPFL